MAHHHNLLLLLPLFISILISSNDHFVSSKTYIVRVEKESKPSVFLEVEHWYEATLQTLHSAHQNSNDHIDNQTNLLLHVYRTVFHGFSAKLTQRQATILSNKPGVMSVVADSLHQLHTTRSPSFLGLYSDDNNKVPGHLLSESDSGSNVIIGFLDTGIWPEHRSFSDEGLDPIPSGWKGECEEGHKFTKANCNRKIIGARFFAKGYQEENGIFNTSEDVLSARDSDGHGTHTASTAAGRSVANASIFGYARGTAVGIAPKARIAVYKVCWKNGCTNSDILSALDKAVEDGVDIVSYSIGGAITNLDPSAIAAFGAMERGVFVSVSAGNDGPTESSLGNVAPWMTLVGASTIDRRFEADLVLGDGRVLKGSSLYSGKPLPKKIPIMFGEECDSLEEEEEEVVRGKMVVCIANDDAYSQEADVKSAGGAAIVVVLPYMGWHGENLQAFVHAIPGLTVTTPTWRTILDYIDQLGSNAEATIAFHGTVLGIKPAPIVASFSSRGPTFVSPFIMKPDLIAPGVNILAAFPKGMSPSGLSSDRRRTEFITLSGTSMSCPHVSGVAALLKGVHPDWTPAMIRSAMMTTAYTKDNRGQLVLDDNDYTNATVWAMGAGHVDPEKAVDPGLVYDVSPNDYLNYLCASNYSTEGIRSVSNKSCNKRQSQPWDLNYPAITVDFNTYDKMEIVVSRTVTHVLETPGTYAVKVVSPGGVDVSVTPVEMKFKGKGEKQCYRVSIKASKLTVAPGESATDVGEIVWSDGQRNVVSPVVMMWKKDY